MELNSLHFKTERAHSLFLLQINSEAEKRAAVHQVLLRVTFRIRASCKPWAHRRVAWSCFSIDLFALQPSFTICDQPRLQLQTAQVYARSNTPTHTCTHTCTARSSSRISNTLEDRCFQACWQEMRKFYLLAPKWRRIKSWLQHNTRVNDYNLPSD